MSLVKNFQFLIDIVNENRLKSNINEIEDRTIQSLVNKNLNKILKEDKLEKRKELTLLELIDEKIKNSISGYIKFDVNVPTLDQSVERLEKIIKKYPEALENLDFLQKLHEEELKRGRYLLTPYFRHLLTIKDKDNQYYKRLQNAILSKTEKEQINIINDYRQRPTEVLKKLGIIKMNNFFELYIDIDNDGVEGEKELYRFYFSDYKEKINGDISFQEIIYSSEEMTLKGIYDFYLTRLKTLPDINPNNSFEIKNNLDRIGMEVYEDRIITKFNQIIYYIPEELNDSLIKAYRIQNQTERILGDDFNFLKNFISKFIKLNFEYIINTDILPKNIINLSKYSTPIFRNPRGGYTLFWIDNWKSNFKVNYMEFNPQMSIDEFKLLDKSKRKKIMNILFMEVQNYWKIKRGDINVEKSLNNVDIHIEDYNFHNKRNQIYVNMKTNQIFEPQKEKEDLLYKKKKNIKTDEYKSSKSDEDRKHIQQQLLYMKKNKDSYKYYKHEYYLETDIIDDITNTYIKTYFSTLELKKENDTTKLVIVGENYRDFYNFTNKLINSIMIKMDKNILNKPTRFIYNLFPYPLDYVVCEIVGDVIGYKIIAKDTSKNYYLKNSTDQIEKNNLLKSIFNDFFIHKVTDNILIDKILLYEREYSLDISDIYPKTSIASLNAIYNWKIKSLYTSRHHNGVGINIVNKSDLLINLQMLEYRFMQQLQTQTQQPEQSKQPIIILLPTELDKIKTEEEKERERINRERIIIPDFEEMGNKDRYNNLGIKNNLVQFTGKPRMIESLKIKISNFLPEKQKERLNKLQITKEREVIKPIPGLAVRLVGGNYINNTAEVIDYDRSTGQVRLQLMDTNTLGIFGGIEITENIDNIRLFTNKTIDGKVHPDLKSDLFSTIYNEYSFEKMREKKWEEYNSLVGKDKILFAIENRRILYKRNLTSIDRLNALKKPQFKDVIGKEFGSMVYLVGGAYAGLEGKINTKNMETGKLEVILLDKNGHPTLTIVNVSILDIALEEEWDKYSKIFNTEIIDKESIASRYLKIGVYETFPHLKKEGIIKKIANGEVYIEEYYILKNDKNELLTQGLDNINLEETFKIIDYPNIKEELENKQLLYDVKIDFNNENLYGKLMDKVIGIIDEDTNKFYDINSIYKYDVLHYKYTILKELIDNINNIDDRPYISIYDRVTNEEIMIELIDVYFDKAKFNYIIKFNYFYDKSTELELIDNKNSSKSKQTEIEILNKVKVMSTINLDSISKFKYGNTIVDTYKIIISKFEDLNVGDEIKIINWLYDDVLNIFEKKESQMSITIKEKIKKYKIKLVENIDTTLDLIKIITPQINQINKINNQNKFNKKLNKIIPSIGDEIKIIKGLNENKKGIVKNVNTNFLKPTIDNMRIRLDNVGKIISPYIQLVRLIKMKKDNFVYLDDIGVNIGIVKNSDILFYVIQKSQQLQLQVNETEILLKSMNLRFVALDYFIKKSVSEEGELFWKALDTTFVKDNILYFKVLYDNDNIPTIATTTTKHYEYVSINDKNRSPFKEGMVDYKNIRYKIQKTIFYEEKYYFILEPINKNEKIITLSPIDVFKNDNIFDIYKKYLTLSINDIIRLDRYDFKKLFYSEPLTKLITLFPNLNLDEFYGLVIDKGGEISHTVESYNDIIINIDRYPETKINLLNIFNEEKWDEILKRNSIKLEYIKYAAIKLGDIVKINIGEYKGYIGYIINKIIKNLPEQTKYNLVVMPLMLQSQTNYLYGEIIKKIVNVDLYVDFSNSEIVRNRDSKLYKGRIDRQYEKDEELQFTDFDKDEKRQISHKSKIIIKFDESIDNLNLNNDKIYFIRKINDEDVTISIIILNTIENNPNSLEIDINPIHNIIISPLDITSQKEDKIGVISLGIDNDSYKDKNYEYGDVSNQMIEEYIDESMEVDEYDMDFDYGEEIDDIEMREKGDGEYEEFEEDQYKPGFIPDSEFKNFKNEVGWGGKTKVFGTGKVRQYAVEDNMITITDNKELALKLLKLGIFSLLNVDKSSLNITIIDKIIDETLGLDSIDLMLKDAEKEKMDILNKINSDTSMTDEDINYLNNRLDEIFTNKNTELFLGLLVRFLIEYDYRIGTVEPILMDKVKGCLFQYQYYPGSLFTDIQFYLNPLFQKFLITNRKIGENIKLQNTNTNGIYDYELIIEPLNKNNLFMAVKRSFNLYIRDDDLLDVSDYRDSVIEWLSDNKDNILYTFNNGETIYLNDLLDNWYTHNDNINKSPNDNTNVSDYINWMRNDVIKDNYGGVPELIALSNLLQVNIYIYDQNSIKVVHEDNREKIMMKDEPVFIYPFEVEKRYNYETKLQNPPNIYIYYASRIDNTDKTNRYIADYLAIKRT
jgi:hypothetical protein